MEPANLDHPGAGDPLDKLLREATPRIEDRGFSTGVMAAVDADRQRARFRLWFMLAGGATGLAVAAAAGAFGSGMADVSADLQRSFADVAALAANPAVAIAGVIIVAALIYVFRRHESDASLR